jgi:hypothetical protein
MRIRGTPVSCREPGRCPVGSYLVGEGYVPVAADKSHSRIIWDCAWAQEGDVFATASRDKTVRYHVELPST